MSKLLIPLIAIFVIAWLWRSARDRRAPPPTRTAKAPKQLSAMVPCAYCGVHVPQETTVRGTRGTYCCESHLRAAHDTPAPRK